MSELSWEADWVQSQTHRKLSADEARCIDTLSVIQRPYNWILVGDKWDLHGKFPGVQFGETYVIARMAMTFSTFDMDELTRLTLAAHRNAVRISISAGAYEIKSNDDYDGYHVPYLSVAAHARTRDGVRYERHPTIEQAIEAFNG